MTAIQIVRQPLESCKTLQIPSIQRSEIFFEEFKLGYECLNNLVQCSLFFPFLIIFVFVVSFPSCLFGLSARVAVAVVRRAGGWVLGCAAGAFRVTDVVW
jgi:hypothetical protein